MLSIWIGKETWTNIKILIREVGVIGITEVKLVKQFSFVTFYVNCFIYSNS